jgi:peptide/nickel transport system substrate-binding protein
MSGCQLVPGAACRRPAARFELALLVVLALLGCTRESSGLDPSVLRIAPHSDLNILDPIWTTATISTNHGYMIYDTLFGMDIEGRIRPQMVESYHTSEDAKTWTFRLRENLEFHDGSPVTSEDVVASLQRWGQRDAMGQKLLQSVAEWQVPDPRTFRIHLSAPYGLVLESLGKPAATVPFVMPARVAATPAHRQIDDFTGSGPFIFRKDEWKPGEVVVYVRNPRYVPRDEPPSGTAGGKVARVERVEWVIIRDPQTQANALVTGEIDVIEMPAYELYRSLKRNPDVEMLVLNALGGQNLLRFNHREPPFDNVKVRQAAMAALNQPIFLQAQVGISGMYRTCFSFYPCGTPYATSAGMNFIAEPDPLRAMRLLDESGYDGSPVILLHPTDTVMVARLPVVAAQLLRQAGFNVDMQSMNWQSMVARRARKTGWHLFLTNAPGVALVNPVVSYPLSASCDEAWVGWPCDPRLEELRDAFAHAPDEQERKRLAEQVQLRAIEIGTHVPLGEYVLPVAARKNVKGLLAGPQTMVLWNVEKL